MDLIFPGRWIPFCYTPDGEGIPLKTENVTKLRLFFKNVELLDGVTELLEGNYPVSALTCEAVSSHEELAGQNGFVEIIPREFGKSRAIDVLRRRKKYPAQRHYDSRGWAERLRDGERL